MFNYDVAMDSLENFSDLSREKQTDLLSTILLDVEFREWFYSTSKVSKSQPVTTVMLSSIIKKMAEPKMMYPIIEFAKKHILDKSASVFLYLIAEAAIESINSTSSRNNQDSYTPINAYDYEIGSYTSYGDNERYLHRVDDLMQILDRTNSNAIRKLMYDAKIDSGLAVKCFYAVPESRYMYPKYKLIAHMYNMLKEVYIWIGERGLPENVNIKWTPLFKQLFEDTSSIAINLAMDDMSSIVEYEGFAYFEDICVVWDSLTSWALTTLDNTNPEKLSQLMEVYLKRVAKAQMNRNGEDPIQLRIDFSTLDIKQFSNILETIRSYQDALDKIQEGAYQEVLNGPKPAKIFNNETHYETRREQNNKRHDKDRNRNNRRDAQRDNRRDEYLQNRDKGQNKGNGIDYGSLDRGDYWDDSDNLKFSFESDIDKPLHERLDRSDKKRYKAVDNDYQNGEDDVFYDMDDDDYRFSDADLYDEEDDDGFTASTSKIGPY